MRVLLDTHIALWFWMGSDRCSPAILKLLQDTHNEVIFSQVSTLEIQLKYQTGRLKLPYSPDNFIPEAVEEAGFQYEPISDKAIYLLGKLPPIHDDLFDRILVAEAIVFGATLASVDRHVLRYPVPTIS